MRTTTSIVHWFAVLLLLICEARAVTVSLTIHDASVGPADPILFSVVVTNDTDDVVHLANDWEACGGLRIYWQQGTSGWHRLIDEQLYLTRPLLRRMETKPEMRMELHPRDSRSLEFFVFCDPVRTSREKHPVLLFDKPGTYGIKATCLIDGEVVESEHTAFYVQPYTGSDLAAYEFLKSRQATHFLFSGIRWRGILPVGDGKRLAAEVLERFPQSHFSPWAELYLLRVELAEGLTNASSLRVAAGAQKLKRMRIPVLSDDAQVVTREVARWRSEHIGRGGNRDTHFVRKLLDCKGKLVEC